MTAANRMKSMIWMELEFAEKLEKKDFAKTKDWFGVWIERHNAKHKPSFSRTKRASSVSVEV